MKDLIISTQLGKMNFQKVSFITEIARCMSLLLGLQRSLKSSRSTEEAPFL